MVARLDKVLTEFDKADSDSNGHIDQREWEKLELEDRRRRLDDENSKRDQQRKMVWFALTGMLLYPFSIVLTSWLGLKEATASLSSIAGVYFTLTGQLAQLKLDTIRMHDSVEINSEFRILWPRGELGALPDDAVQDLNIEYIQKELDKLQLEFDEHIETHNQNK